MKKVKIEYDRHGVPITEHFEERDFFTKEELEKLEVKPIIKPCFICNKRDWVYRVTISVCYHCLRRFTDTFFDLNYNKQRILIKPAMNKVCSYGLHSYSKKVPTLEFSYVYCCSICIRKLGYLWDRGE